MDKGTLADRADRVDAAEVYARVIVAIAG